MSVSQFSGPASSDLATLAQLARDGSLDLTTVAFRVRTDLMVGLATPTKDELSSFLEFAAAALPKLQERDLAIVSQKLAAWPHTPAELKAALILRLPAASAMFSLAAAEKADVGETRRAGGQADHELPAAPPADSPASRPSSLTDLEALRQELLPAAASAAPKAATTAAPTAATTASPAVSVDPDTSLPAIDMPPVGENLAPQDRVDAARLALLQGDERPARAILADPSLGPPAHAAFFLLATPVQQSLMLSGLAHLERSQPRRSPGPRERKALERILDLAGHDRTGAFLALSDAVGGTPEFAARVTLDDSRKLSGLCILAIGGNDEDAVRFALRLADGPACDVATIFALADMARAASPSVAARLVRAIGGGQVQMGERAGQHVPVADPSGTPQRLGGLGQSVSGQGAAEKRGLSPQEAARRLLAG
jgi:hypothetical protein